MNAHLRSLSLFLPVAAVVALAIARGEGAAPSVLDATPRVAAAPEAAPATVAPAPATTVVRSGDLAMPDGSRLPPLNGAVDPPKPRWQKGRPYSPVVSTAKLADGRDTYVHADGSRTTTFMTWRADLGRMVAVTHVLSPAPSQQALVDEELTRR